MQHRAFVGVLGVGVFLSAVACTGNDVATIGGAGSGGAPAATGGAGGGISGAGGSAGGVSGTGGAGPGDAAPAIDAPVGEANPVPGARRHGKSPGCGMAGGMAGNQTLSFPKCMGCSA